MTTNATSTSLASSRDITSINFESTSIYIEMLWVLVLFGSTALLRVSVGEMCMQWIAKGVFGLTVSFRFFAIVS